MILDKRELYRLPWSMNDNPIAWLEVTDSCNLHCEGCYRRQLNGHKPLAEIREEIRLFKQWRNPDNVSIAGGEPLLHPDILEIIAFIAAQGIKPIVLTNGTALTPELLRELKRAGLAGFTIHIDSSQNRPDWSHKSELELNPLRQHFADLIAAVRGIYVVFNATVFPATLGQVPDVVRWGLGNIDRVHGLVFITYRTATTADYIARDAADREVDLAQLSYSRAAFDEEFVTAPQVAGVIAEACPEYQPCSYLGGSVLHTSYKWLIGAVIGTRRRIYGSVGRKTMELTQVAHHAFVGTYLAYLSTGSIGRRVFVLSPVDGTVRKAGASWFGDLLRHPRRIFDQPHVQSIGIIQAPDVLPDGRTDMCDSCPDMTFHDGKLINSCRMDEYRLFGGFLSFARTAADPGGGTTSQAGNMLHPE